MCGATTTCMWRASVDLPDRQYLLELRDGLRPGATVGLVSSLYPALRAAAVQPAVAVRSD